MDNVNNISVVKPETITKKKRGRPRKVKLSLEEQEDEVILKYLYGEPMTLEETALALWMRDGRPEGGPMTKMGMLKMEQRILKKLRKACEEAGIGIDAFEEIFKSKHDTAAASRNYKVLMD